MATVVSSGPTLLSTGEATPSRSAVSWAAILAGAIVGLATTLILVALGGGLGFAAASPWPGAGATATTFAIGAGIWLIVVQWLSSALGGYITGRLRTRWAGVHDHEVVFRDTAHGLLAWAVATIVVVGVALGVTASTVSATSGAASAVSYATDTMLRADRPVDGDASGALRAQLGRVLAREGPLAADDRTYLVRVVARQTGVSQAEASARVDAATDSIRSAADKARKVSSALGFFTALSMLIGAFIAATAAAYAGRLRDDEETKYRV
jgi:hypothetical protein